MAKAIMVQGTMSNAGKSLVTAGLCRVFNQDGYKVAPFKSQNMALNSFITRNGAEMGRAQVVQAEAANIEPSALMNPILLKPTSDKGSQVIVNGEAIGTMTASEYFAFKTQLIPEIMKAYNQLDAENEVIVIEGAGSPAEINLRGQDIVNMGMAKMAKSPVLLVADIDRGGVFASIYGTLMLLEEDERAMVKGLVINKFRGDINILRPGLEMIEEKTGIPVVGVLPMLKVDIEDEDSLSERLDSRSEIQAVDIAVVKIPRMSNYTDFNVFELIPGVSLRYVKSVGELQNPDMIIIPGTKNTIGDLLWLRQSGFEAEILKKAHAGTVVFGICGGYQMLGTKLSDPFGVEEGGDIAGIGLLDVETIFAEKKRTIQVEGNFNNVQGIFKALSGCRFHGYEIHSGVTNFAIDSSLSNMKPIYEEGDILPEGSQNITEIMNVYGSYVHGIFDGDGIAKTIVDALLAKKGMKPEDVHTISFVEYKKQQYDILAEEVRKNLDMKKIYEILKRESDMEQGLIHIYCGNGKGKTTAALGLALRCAGRGNKVLFVQFLKSRPTGELSSLKSISNIELMRGKEIMKFTFQMTDEEKQQVLLEHEQLFDRVVEKCKEEKIDLLILDEVVGACNTGVFNMDRLIDFMKNKPYSMEMVLTGRDPKPELIELADYVSEIRKIKHPYDKGIPARTGIER